MKAKVLWNSTKKWATALAPRIKEFLKGKGVSIAGKKADFTIVAGGDGTILFNREKLEGPVFAIGSTSSHICQCTEENWEHALSQFLTNPRYEERIMLDARHRGKAYTAINDIAVLSANHRVLTLKVGIGSGECCFDADGVVVSTPTGSTAYAYAAGGPVIEPTLEVLSIVPVAPDKKMFDPLVISASNKSYVSPGTDAHLIIDGGKPILMRKGERVEIKKTKRKLLFAIK